MDNPFVYGEVVPGEAFADREAGARPAGLATSPRDRRFSLSRQAIRQVVALRQASRRPPPRALTVEVTVSSYSSYLAFLESYARALAGAERRDRARTWPTEAIASTRPQFRYEPKAMGQPRLSIAFPPFARRATRSGSPPKCSPCPAARRRAPANCRGRARRVPGDRRFNGGNVEHAIARRCRISATSAMSLPAQNPA